MRPVTSNPSEEAAELLRFIASISGAGTLVGQHNTPIAGSSRLDAVHKATGRHPALFGQDFGFAAAGDMDGINFRQRTIDEAIRRSRDGFIVTLMWHAVRPIEEEPATFRDSICGKVTHAQWNELVADGTEINARWKSQVDVIASYLKQLRDANVPILWRPYHEMNGGWFWWGKRSGDGGYRKLYRMLFDRLANVHQLNNLLWVCNGNEVTPGVDAYETYYPGDDVVDILATDVYRGGFAQKDYDDLLALARGKPIALGEVGELPSPQILDRQPRWAWLMVWHDPSEWLRNREEVAATLAHPRMITWDRLAGKQK
jgi:mannan endo-1,4-beta-mannosidase